VASPLKSVRPVAFVAAVVVLAGGVVLLLSSTEGEPSPTRTAPGAAIVTGSQAQLRREGVRVRVQAAGPVRAYLSSGAWAVPVTVERRARKAGAFTLPLTPAGKLAAASCVPLTLVVRGRGGESSRRDLRPEGRTCDPPAADVAFTPAATAPVDASQLTRLPFGDRSHWLQPARAWSDTPPAARLLAAPGINFNVDPAAAASAAKALAAQGVRRARIEIGWNGLSYDDPRRLAEPARSRRMLLALQKAGLRPLILLNANQSGPGPARAGRLTLRSPAPAGARTVQLARSDVARVQPGLTGFDAVDSDRRPDVLITAVDRAGVATLARPLPQPLEAGRHAVSTLRYAPFQRPQLPGGAANPAFEATVRGWLAYTGTVSRFARDILGGWGFDVEIWNELSFGSDFLDASRYFDPLPAAEGDTNRAILERTVAWLRDPANRIGAVGIADGFASQTPFAAGSTSPRGLTALSKHPYVSVQQFPGASEAHADQPLVGPSGEPAAFVPSYEAYFPEYWLTGIQTETLVRDLAPQTTEIGGVAHGRTTAPTGGRPPAMWLTEFNLVPPSLDAARPGPDGERARSELSDARAKGLLRALVAYVHAGVAAIDFYAATGNDYGLAPTAFLTSGGRGAAGAPLTALGRLSGALEGARTAPRRRELQVKSIADIAGRTQFTGDGTPAHPPLYDRDVLAVLPFQLGDHDWVVPVYVESRDVRRDVPAERYRVALGGLGGKSAQAGFYDPLTGRFEPVRISARDDDGVTIDLLATDSPKLLFLTD
jgi:hypothetical protein